jgi:UDP-N-acetylmuramoyl-L-alanyl-D-glutamate--2,6-diaminopimelate ligase
VNLIELLSEWTSLSFPDSEITGIHNNSKLIKPGHLFLAYPGFSADGRDYIKQAIENGAIAIAVDPIDFDIKKYEKSNAAIIPVVNLSKIQAKIAVKFYNNPSKELYITGVTGTNGKTTIAYQLAMAHNILGGNASYIGTLGHGNTNKLHLLNNTTPDAISLQKLFFDYKEAGVKQICMEVSSHALCEGRVNGVEFNQAIYTNLSHDHLDYHKTMQDYAKAKAKFFEAPGLNCAILNNDDAYVDIMKNSIVKGCKQVTYGIKNNSSDIFALNCKTSFDGSEFDVKSLLGFVRIKIKSIGIFNIYNALAVYTSLLQFGYSLNDAGSVMKELSPSVGRMEIVSTRPYVIIDYAHTPDALKNVLLTLIHVRKISKSSGKIWVIFGCGGDRDALKRPIMGEVATTLADYVVVTSDNPRTEDPELIIADIEKGFVDKSKVCKIVNRKEAIETTLAKVSIKDIVLIAGKGHEEYQQVGNIKYDFSDKKIAQEFLIT